MLQSLLSYFQSFFSHTAFRVITMWVTFGCALAWYLLSAKRYQEITPQEADLLWKTHKQFNYCIANKFEPIKKGKRLVGYKCQCGHETQQKRPIINFGLNKSPHIFSRRENKMKKIETLRDMEQELDKIGYSKNAIQEILKWAPLE